MKKRLFVYVSFLICLLLLLFYEFLVFSFYNTNQIYDGRNGITATKSDDMTNEEYISIIQKAAESIGSDIIIYVQTPEDDIYYVTDSVPSDLDLLVEGGNSNVSPGEVLSENKEESTRYLYNFNWYDDGIKIRSVQDASEQDLDISYLLLKTSYIEQITSYLSENNIEISTEVGASATEEMTSLIFIIVSAMFFFGITLIYYAFTRKNDIAVKKSLGYSSAEILKYEFKQFISTILIIAVICIITAFIGLSAVFDIGSSLVFMLKISWKLILFLLGVFVIINSSFLIISSGCKVEDIKGKSSSKGLFRFICIVKTIVFVVLIVNLSQMFDPLMKTINGYRMMSKTAEKLNGYYKTEVYTLVEDPENCMDSYREQIEGFYEKMHDKYGCILADNKGKTVEGFKGRLSVTVNDNYIEFCDVYDKEGQKYTASDFSEDQLTVLFPEENEYDYKRILKLCRNYYKIEDDDIDVRYYDASKSSLFSFDVNRNTDTNGFYTDVAIIVSSPKLDPRAAESLYSKMCGSMIFNCGNTEDAYSEVYPVIEEFGLEHILLKTPSVTDDFKISLKSQKQAVIYQSIISLTYFIFIIILMVYASVLYYIDNAKDISVKMLNGNSFLSVFGYRMIFKAAVIVLLGVLSFFIKYNIMFAFVLVIIEQIIFITEMKKNSEKRITSVLKGE